MKKYPQCGREYDNSMSFCLDDGARVELAILYTGLGEKEKAFASLEKAFTARDLQMQFLGVDPAFDDLRPDPRFKKLVRKLNLPGR